MQMNEIKVEYSYVDGAHFFTGKDAFALGLCVAHADLKTAFEEVPVQLVNLLEVNKGIKAKVVPGVTFEELSNWVKASQQPATPKIKPKQTTANLPFNLEARAAA